MTKTNKYLHRSRNRNVRIGQTLETNDLFLPYPRNKKPLSKNRPVIVVDKNKKQELVVVPGSTEDTPNTTHYNKYGILYYRHNIEIEDSSQQPIKVNEKFRITEKSTKLPVDETKNIFNRVLNHTKFSSENRKKYSKFKKR